MRKYLQDGITIMVILLIVGFFGYAIVGTSYNVDKIRREVPDSLKIRNWKILRYEGYKFGSFDANGGKVCYHVANIDNPNIQYRLEVTMWFGQLQYYYGQPEILERLQVNLKDTVK